MTRERAAGLRRWARAHHDALILGGLAVLAYVAANNRFQAMMPWAIAALLGATVLTGLFWPRWLVRRLSVERSGPDRAVEGERITFEVEVEKRLPFAVVGI